MSAADYDAYVAQLVAANVDPVAARREAARRFPEAAREKQIEAERRENVFEKDEQREVRKLFIAFGFRVYWLSQARKSGQTAGLADLYCVHRVLPIALWFETKRNTGGQISAAQQQFFADNVRCGVRSIIGDRQAARAFLIREGLAQIVAGVLEPVRHARRTA